MATNPLFLLPTVSGTQVIEPKGVSFSPLIVPANIEVIPSVVSEETVEKFKHAIKNGNQAVVLSRLDELYMDSALLVRALVESAIEHVNIGSPETVSLILQTTRESMEAVAVLQITQLLLRAQKSSKYAEFVVDAETNRDPFFIQVRACLLGEREPPQVEGWESLRGCALRYQAYPFFADVYKKEEKAVTLPKLSARASKKASELAIVR